MAIIKANPNVVLSDEYLDYDRTPATRAFWNSLRKTDYTFPEELLLELLEVVHPNNFLMLDRIFSRPELSTSTLEAYYPKALEWGGSSESKMNILRGMANHPNMPMHLIEDMAKRTDIPAWAARAARGRFKNFKIELLAGQEDLPEDRIQEIYQYALTIYNPRNKNAHRDAELSHRSTPVSWLYEMQEDDSYSVRMALVHNPNTPRSILEKLAEDKNAIIQRQASRKLLWRPRSTADFLKRQSMGE